MRRSSGNSQTNYAHAAAAQSARIERSKEESVCNRHGAKHDGERPNYDGAKDGRFESNVEAEE